MRLLLIYTFFYCFTSQPAIAQTPLPADGVIYGTVLNKQGVPLIGAYIICGGRGASTDENGAYRITGIPIGEQEIELTKCVLGGSSNQCGSSGIHTIKNVITVPTILKLNILPMAPAINVNFTWEKR